MLTVTLAQMRRSVGRLTAAGIAIAIGTGFAMATLLASDVMQRTTYDSVTADFVGADLVVQSPSSGLSVQDVRAAAGTPGVRAAAGQGVFASSLTGSLGTGVTMFVPQSDAPDLRTYSVVDGKAPSAPDEVAVAASVAADLGITIGDTVTTASLVDGAAATTWTVTGLTENRGNALSSYGDVSVIRPDDFTRLGAEATTPWLDSVLVTVDHSASSAQVGKALSTALGSDVRVQTKDEAAQTQVDALSGEQAAFTAFLLAFAALALVVAALVISNTFAVLVAQRARTLALLRCAGGSKKQIRNSVLIEGALLGLVGSVAGAVFALVGGQIVLTVLRQVQETVPLPSRLEVSITTLLVPTIVGVLVTIVACWVPAREATKVAPLAALRPLDVTAASAKSHRVRAAFAALLTIGGIALLAGGVVTSSQSIAFGLAIGVLGGALSFVGIVLGAVFWLPPVSRLLSVLVGRSGPASRLAAANALRHPRRMAATSSALLIGVTLVTMMAVGAASARGTLSKELDAQFPVDLGVQMYPEEASGPVSESDRAKATDEVEGVSGVAAVAAATQVSWIRPDRSTHPLPQIVLIGDPTALRSVLKDSSGLGAATPGLLVLSESAAQRHELSDGDRVRLGEEGSGATLTVRVEPGAFELGFVNADGFDIAALGADGDAQSMVLAAMAPKASAAEVRDDIDRAVTISHSTIAPAAERVQFDRVINVLLGVVVALLSVAVVIALIGVTNTLSLSVIERRRESATLRSIGLSRPQLRRMLAVEGAFITGVGAALGIVLGLAYGWVGSYIVLGTLTSTTLAVPWTQLLGVFAVAAAAGLLASVLPARGALRDSPVEALGVE